MGEFLLKDITYYYSKDRLILDHISQAFESGKIYVILGPSGCGKTTLLSLLGGLDVPKEGAILFNGTEVGKKNLEAHRRANVSFVFQNYNLIDYMTPEENVQLTAKQDALPILEKLGLSPAETKRNVLKLSGGQQQRVAIGRALMNAPQVCLADEPTGSLDSRNGFEIIRLLKLSHQRYGQTLILVTHDENIALQANRIITVSDGRIVRDERQAARQ